MLKRMKVVTEDINQKMERTQISPKKRAPRNAKNKRRRDECPVALGNEYEVQIDQMSPNGEGIGKIKGFSVFVPNVVEGETVTVKITRLDSVSADAQVISRT
jgi:predicted RNA-binding protein with TRAM domain